MQSLPTEAELDAEIGRRSLLEFGRMAWPQIEKASPFRSNWHIELICEYLEAVTRSELRNVIFNVPPGTGKSSWVSVLWNAWEWVVDARLRHIYVTYGDRLSRRDAIKTRDLVSSDWFQARWPGVHIPRQNTRAAKHFSNNQGGFRFSTTVKGGLTGEHGHRIVVDDPIKPDDARGSRAALGTELDNVIEWWNLTASTRGGVDPGRFAQVIIMQRLHQKDLCGHIEDNESGWTIVRLPMRYEPDRGFVGPYGSDPRTEEDELLWPERFDDDHVTKLEERLGPGGTASQLQQRPNPKGGKVFKRPFQYWGAPGTKYPTLPTLRVRYVQAWDMTFKGAPKPGGRRSFVVGQVWAQIGADMLLIDQERGQWGFTEQQKALQRLTGRHPKAHRKFVEDAANGAAIVNAMQSKVGGLKLVSTGGGSEARAEVAATYFESGNVYLPHPSIASWVTELEAELELFPMARYDDQVDALTHAVVQLGTASNASLASAMKKIRGEQ